MRVPYHHQHTDYTCGPTALEMVFDHFKKHVKERTIARIARTTKKYGTFHKGMIDAARKEGFYCYVHENASISQVRHFLDEGLPVIVHYKEPVDNDGHYAVAVGYGKNALVLNDPWNGRNFRVSFKEFEKRWHDEIKGNQYTKWVMVVSPEKFELGKEYAPTK